MNPTVLVAIPPLPLLALVIAGLGGRFVGRAGAHWIACLAVGVSCGLSLLVLKQVYWVRRTDLRRPRVHLAGERRHAHAGRLPGRPFTALMIAVVTFVSLCVHRYTIGYMADDPGYTRFFSYIALFTFSMLMLVMANNFMQLFFGAGKRSAWCRTC